MIGRVKIMQAFLGMLAFIGLISAHLAAVVAIHRFRVEDRDSAEQREAEQPAVRGDARTWSNWLLH
jgi:hypothetical protein